jgi:hypothetical protein
MLPILIRYRRVWQETKMPPFNNRKEDGKFSIEGQKLCILSDI